MAASFLSLPGEVRNKVYKHLLISEKTITPWKGGHGLSPTILATNSLVNQEASALLYGENSLFLAPDYPQRDVAEDFLASIGELNAGKIRSLYLEVPPLNHSSLPIQEGKSIFDETGSATLNMITGVCTQIETVTISPRNIRIVGQHEVPLSFPDGTFSFREGTHDQVLGMIDARLRQIPNLKRVIVEVYSESTAMNKKQVMEALGWEVKDVGPRPSPDPDKDLDWFEDEFSA